MADRSYLTCGLEPVCVTDIVQELRDARDNNFDFIVPPLCHPDYHRDFTGKLDYNAFEPFTRSDLLLSSTDWSQWVVGKASTTSGFDSENSSVRKNSSLGLQQELSWASHLSLPAVILPTPDYNCENYSVVVKSICNSQRFMQLWVRFQLVSPKVSSSESSVTEIQDDSWECWNKLRGFCDHASNLFPVLELTGDLPEDIELDRWFGEPLKAIVLPTSIFLTNKKGFPVLSKKHQAIVQRFFSLKPEFIISGAAKAKGEHKHYLQYLRFLFSKRPQLNQKDQFETPYYDYLQAPLQPLKDNLESQTYETFEKDPIKYQQYEKAVEAALRDRAKEGETTVLMVVGAGRGPLVRASLRASAASNRPLRVYAVEKNPNAVVTLPSRKTRLRNMRIAEGWGDTVTIVDSDMRCWEAPEKADILVSELLGSWGDNELSPECLDGAQKYLKEDGISIPSDYTSYVAPLSTAKLWNGVKGFGDNEKDLETQYVVKVHNAHQLCASKPCFYFKHPNFDDNPIDNSRYTKVEFEIPINSLVHGFVGYFHSTLYKDICISIDPVTFSEGMFSWFPLYIPLKVPIYVKKGESFAANFWRCGSQGKVWYEWSVSSPSVSSIHNPGGRSHWIGL